MSVLGHRARVLAPSLVSSPAAMAAPQPTYDLTLLLDTSAPEDRRKQILDSIRAAISSAGTIVNEQDWGPRALAYEIRHKADAEYHLIQFQGPTSLLEQLDHTLRITDEVVRFRVIKLAPGTPAPPETRPEPRPTSSTVATEEQPPAAAPAGEAPAEEPVGEPAAQ